MMRDSETHKLNACRGEFMAGRQQPEQLRSKGDTNPHADDHGDEQKCGDGAAHQMGFLVLALRQITGEYRDERGAHGAAGQQIIEEIGDEEGQLEGPGGVGIPERRLQKVFAQQAEETAEQHAGRKNGRPRGHCTCFP